MGFNIGKMPFILINAVNYYLVLHLKQKPIKYCLG